MASTQYDSGAETSSDRFQDKGRTETRLRRVSEHSVADMEKSESTMDEKLSSEPASPFELAPGVDPSSSAVKWKARFQLYSLYFVLFLAGWDGGTPGPLIPRIQEVYNVSYRLRLLTQLISVLTDDLGKLYRCIDDVCDRCMRESFVENFVKFMSLKLCAIGYRYRSVFKRLPD